MIIIRTIFILMLIVTVVCSGCAGGGSQRNIKHPIRYNINEPFAFPFEVNEVWTEIAIDNPDVLHQFIFHYKNKTTTQEIRYILSKSITQQETVSKEGKKQVILSNGQKAYYDEEVDTQSIWWEQDDGFLARLVYYCNGGKTTLDLYKLEESDIVDLANQIQP